MKVSQDRGARASFRATYSRNAANQIGLSNRIETLHPEQNHGRSLRPCQSEVCVEIMIERCSGSVVPPGKQKNVRVVGVAEARLAQWIVPNGPLQSKVTFQALLSDLFSQTLQNTDWLVTVRLITRVASGPAELPLFGPLRRKMSSKNRTLCATK